MGLRINNNISAIRALRNLKVNDRVQAQSLERLSTGLRINRAADDPSGLVLSEQLRAQINALKQASDNTDNASGLLAVADNALEEIQKQLTSIKNAVIFAQNTGGSSPEQITAEQDMVNQAIASIDRISATTRYSKRQLLNGNSSFTTTNLVPTSVNSLQIRSVSFPDGSDTRTFTVEVQQMGTRGRIDFGGITVSGTTVLRLTGPLGTQDIALADAATSTAVRGAVNAAAGFTGVVAVSNGTGASTVVMQTSAFGFQSLVQVQVVQGTFDSNAPGFKTSDRGSDASVTVNDLRFQGQGLDFNTLLPSAQFEFSLDPSTPDGLRTGTVAAAPAPTVTTFTSTALIGAPDLIGRLVRFTSGAQSGQQQRISGFNASTGAVTLGAALPGAPAAGDSFDVLAGAPLGTVAAAPAPTVTSFSSTTFSQATAGGLPNLVGRTVRFTGNTTAALAGLERQIVSYNATTNVVTLDSALPVAPAAADTFELFNRFTVRNTGLTFQMREQPNSADKLQVGVNSTMSSVIGFNPMFDDIFQAQQQGGTFNLPPDPTSAQRTLGGFLSSLRTGAGNDLFQNPRNASFIIDRAVDQVSKLRGYLGAVVADNLEPNVDNLGVEIENLTAAESIIRDLNFAEETANFTRSQILFQAGTAVVASANLIPQTVLTLLR